MRASRVCPVIALIAEDLPALDRPAKAISASLSAGQPASLAALVVKWVWLKFIKIQVFPVICCVESTRKLGYNSGPFLLGGVETDSLFALDRVEKPAQVCLDKLPDAISSI